MREEGGGRGRTEIAAGPHWLPAKYPFRGDSSGGSGGGRSWKKKERRGGIFSRGWGRESEIVEGIKKDRDEERAWD